MPAGRPSNYTEEIADEICNRLAEGESLNSICKDEHMPHERRVRYWALEDREGFSPKYARAREIQAEYWADEIIGISDDGTNDWMRRQRETKGVRTVENAEAINRSKLRVDARKWLVSKLLPKKYGDRLDHNVGGELKVTIASSDAEL